MHFSRGSWLASFLLLAACDAAPGGSTDASALDAASSDATSASDAAVDLPPGVQRTDHALNIVDSAAAAEIRAYLRSESPELGVGASVLYQHVDDEYDFVFVFSDADVAGAQAAARYTPVHRPALPSVGIPSDYQSTAYGDHPHLRAVVGVNFSASGNGPLLHETLHHWGTFLDRSFGFGRDRDNDFGPHWGVASVFGQHGGFDASTVRCSTPADAPLPCSPDPDGVTRLSIGSFGPAANGGDGIPYAPIELYLMGLASRDEVPSPIVVLDGAHFVDVDPATDRLSFEITGTHTVSIEEIIAVHGERPPAPPEDRAFRAAFVCFSDAPLSATQMSALERWAAVFGNDATLPPLHSFEDATGARATMSTRLGAVR